jgi:CheY-like chemotaxis protein
VEEADNGAKALAAIEAQNFDLVLMDMVMPEMDGIEATQRLRQELQGDAAVPVMGLTANVNPNDLERFAKAGVDDTVLKPFEQEKLCAQVQHLLNKKKSARVHDVVRVECPLDRCASMSDGSLSPPR